MEIFVLVVQGNSICARTLKMVGLGNMKFVWVTILGKLGPVFGVHQYWPESRDKEIEMALFRLLLRLQICNELAKDNETRA